MGGTMKVGKTFGFGSAKLIVSDALLETTIGYYRPHPAQILYYESVFVTYINYNRKDDVLGVFLEKPRTI